MLMAGTLVGLALLILGRRLFWLFVGGVGFVAGIRLAMVFLRVQSDWRLLGIALIVGLLGALLAVWLQRFAVGVAGFIAGGYLLTSVAAGLGWDAGLLSWLLFLVGGTVGAALVAALFDWALIALSSLTGATLIVQTFGVGPPLAAILLFAGLLVAGIAVQARLLRRARASSAA